MDSYRKNSRRCSARSNVHQISSLIRSSYARRLRVEALEDRRVLAVIMVTNDTDADAGSLRQAILDANLSVGVPDEIVFDASLSGGQIDIASQLPTITDELTITGPGANLLTIDAGDGADNTFNTQDGYRIFQVDDGLGGDPIHAEIHGLTLTGGDQLGQGGAILNLEHLTVTDSTISGNAASSGGGGILNRGGGTVLNVGCFYIKVRNPPRQ